MPDRAGVRWWPGALQFISALAMAPYLRTAYRIRAWGGLPLTRGPALVIPNLQHDLDDMAIVGRILLDGPWVRPVYAVSAQLMFEPGFLALRLPWLGSLLRTFNPEPLMRGLGLVPIENQLVRRPILRFAHTVLRREANLPLERVFDERALAALDAPKGTRLEGLYRGELFGRAQRVVKLSWLREPFRDAIAVETRDDLREDLARIETLLQRGATVYFAPEGTFSTDGRLGRFARSLERFAPLANVYLAAVSYDPLRGGRLSMLLRILPVADGDLARELKAARPVTVSQLLADWLITETPQFTREEAYAAIRTRLERLPATLFVDPELRAHPERVTGEALATMVRLKLLQRDGARYQRGARRSHPQFPRVDDILAYQARFHAETLGA